MKKELKIPTLIAILIIIIGVVVTSFLTGQTQNFFSRADITTSVKNLKKSNITDNSFTVSWTTDKAVSGVMSYSDKSGGPYKIVEDDRVQAGSEVNKFYTHHSTVRLLKPLTNYYFKIISDKQEITDKSYTVTTGPVLNSSNSVSVPVYGTVLQSNQSPVAGALVYVSVNNSAPLSTLTKSSGNWLVTINNARTSDLSKFVSFQPQGDKEDIFVQGEKDVVSQIKVITGNDAPVPNIILGQDFDFSVVNTASQNIVSATLTPIPSSTAFTQTPIANPTPAILSPNSNSTISDSHPTIQGVGIPGQVVQIIIQSEQTMAASVVVGSDGRWSWTPVDTLDPGEHTVTIATADSSGQTKTVSQNFIVLASGTSVTESATPSATPIFTPTPSASPSPMPQSGSVTQTSLLLIAGMSILILGTFIFYVSAF